MFKKLSLLKLFDLLLLVVAIYLLFAPMPEIALATHPNYNHNRYIHSVNTREWVCVDISNATGINFTTARDRVKNTLRYDNTGSDWHALAFDGVGYRIYFEFHTNSCGSLSPGELATMRGRVYVKNNLTVECGDPTNTSSCTEHWSAISTHGSSIDYAYERVWALTAHMLDTSPPLNYHHTVSHEFGHMLGLRDGNSPNDTYCNPPNNQNSIMHPLYYCPGAGHSTFEWPTSDDRSAVTTIANSIIIP